MTFLSLDIITFAFLTKFGRNDMIYCIIFILENFQQIISLILQFNDISQLLIYFYSINGYNVP